MFNAGALAAMQIMLNAGRESSRLSEAERLRRIRADAEPDPGTFDGRVKIARARRHNRQLFLDRLEAAYAAPPVPRCGSIRARKLTLVERVRMWWYSIGR